MNIEKLIKVYEFAKTAHNNQKRDNGEPYISHPVAVAEIARTYGADEPTIYACLLHDVVEDTPVKLKDIRERFGEQVMFLVNGVSKENQSEGEYFSKVRNFSLIDKRTAIIKLADRIHNVSTPKKSDDWKKRYNNSTSYYIYLGQYLGFGKMADELNRLREKNLK